MAIEKLVLLHSMSSSSDALRSKRALEQRNLKLKQELEKEKAAARGRVSRRSPVQSARGRSIGTVDSDDNIISKPRSSSSLSVPRAHRFRDRSLRKLEILELSKQKTKNSNLADPILSIASSSSSFGCPTDDNAILPSERVRNIFQRAPPVEKGRGGAIVRKLIEERQAKLVQEVEEEEHEEDEPQDLRSIYQKYLAGQIEKECVVRSGNEWTSRYKDRRRQIAHKKMRQASGIGEEKPTHENTAEEKSAKQLITRRYQRRNITPFREMPADQQQQSQQ